MKTYRAFIADEFQQRSQLNPSYSLRAYARDLGVSPSFLSELLNGKHGLSSVKAIELANKLNLDEDEHNLFCNLVDSEHARSNAKKQKAVEKINKIKHEAKFKAVSLDQFRVIRDWYHLAILETFKVRGQSGTAEEIAMALDVPLAEIKIGLNRLAELGCVEKRNNKYHLLNSEISISSQVPSREIRYFHKQMINKAIDALDSQSVGDREFSANVLAVDKSDIPKMKEYLINARRDFHQKFGKSKNKNTVYSLSIQLFELFKEGNRR